MHKSLYVLATAATLAFASGAAQAMPISGNGLRDALDATNMVEKTAVYIVEGRRYCFYFSGWHGADLPSEVTLADSAGTFVASYRTRRATDVRPMAVSVYGADVVATGMTAAGLLTLHLHDQNGDGTALVGRWMLGEQEGSLRGRLAPNVAAGARP